MQHNEIKKINMENMNLDSPEVQKFVSEAIEAIVEFVTPLIDAVVDFIKTVAEIVEKYGVTKLKSALITPRRKYGMFKEKPRNNKVQSRYFYAKPISRNLPYQRRCF